MASFFFSSRGRHTRDIGDWSSDVCSSDLAATRHKVYPPRRVNFMARGCGFRVEFHWKSGTESASRSLHRLVRPLVRFLYNTAIKLSDLPVDCPVRSMSHSGVGLELHG